MTRKQAFSKTYGNKEPRAGEVEMTEPEFDYEIDAVLANLVQRFNSLGVSRRFLARLAGLHPNTLQGFGIPLGPSHQKKQEKPLVWSPSVATLRAIEGALCRLEADAHLAKGRR
jgi:hypothetical protein